MKRLPIGISDFKELIENNYYYVDKTLLVKEFLKASGVVILIARPRRFGKTLNLSMLRYFFEQSSKDSSDLFTNTAIWHELDYRSLQGQYPVIFLTFKDVKEDTWENTYKKLREIIASEFARHLPFVQESLPDYELQKYMALLTNNADEETYSTSLHFLSKILSDYHNKNVMVLIDNYDVPILEGYMNQYYSQVVGFFWSFLTSVYKDNVYLERGILTSVLCIPKEGIFSGFNNLRNYTITHSKFQDQFGFTQPEVKQLLKD